MNATKTGERQLLEDLYRRVMDLDWDTPSFTHAEERKKEALRRLLLRIRAHLEEAESS